MTRLVLVLFLVTHLVSGDVQSAGIPDIHVHSPSHDAFELPDR